MTRSWMHRAQLDAIEALPQMAAAICSMQVYASRAVPVAGVDKRCRVSFNPDYEPEPAEAVGVFLHECLHPMLGYWARWPGTASATAWNLCHDAEINGMLKRAGIELPKGCIYGDTLPTPCPDTWAAEGYWRVNSEAAAQSTDTLGSDAKDAPAEPAEGEQLPDGLDADQVESVREAVSKAVSRSAKRDPSLQPLADRLASQVPAAPPRTVGRLVSALSRFTARAEAVAGQSDTSYGRRNRRQGTSRIIRPGWIDRRLAVGLVMDVSGSMPVEAIGEAIAACRGSLTGCEIEAVACTDQVVATGHRLTAAGLGKWAAELTAGGGTDLRVGIAELLKGGRIDCLLIATDCATPWGERGPRVPVLILKVAAGHNGSAPDWASVVELEGLR